MQDVRESPAIEADVIVVGAGFAGVTAAREIKRAGRTVALLEARTRVGGRSLSQPIGDGQIVELGCEHLGRPDSIAASTGRAVGIAACDCYDDGFKLTDADGELLRWKGAIPKAGPAVLADLAQASLRIEWMRREVPEGAPWDAPHAGRWDTQTMWSWMQRNVRTKGARSLIRVLIEASIAASPSEMSVLHVLNYSNALGGFRAMTTVSGGALGQRFVGGSQGVVKRLAQEIDAEVHLGARVRRVQHHADRVKVAGDGFEAVGRCVVMAIPLPLAARVDYDPVLPPRRDQLTQRMPLGSAIKYLVLYDEPFWRGDGLSGTVISHHSPIRAVMDGSPPDHPPGVLTGFVTGPAARKLAVHDEAERRSIVLKELARFFGPKASQPRGFFEQNWMAEPFTRGCYHGYAPPGLYTLFGPALKEPIGRIHWAGAESVPMEYGSMSGAIHSGIRAAREVIEHFGDRHDRPGLTMTPDASPAAR